MKKVFITGTDTDAGKTLVATTLLYKAQIQGLSSFGLKPIAAGCDWHDQSQTWVNDDALMLQKASQPVQKYSLHNPIALPQAIAPHIAAKLEQQELTLSQLIQACDQGLKQEVDFHLVEGAGGWLVPLNDHETLADFAHYLTQEQGYDIILVVGMKLGCINHALLTQQAIVNAGLTIKAWVANHVDPNMSEQDANFDYLASHIQAPCLGRIPYSPNTCAKQLVEYLDLPN